MRMLHNGENLNQKELYEIVDNFYVSKHARERIYERDMTIREMKSIIESPILAYYNTDGTINIAKDEYHYFVITWNEGYNNFIVIIYKEKSNNNIDIFEKQRMAQKGIDRLKRVC